MVPSRLTLSCPGRLLKTGHGAPRPAPPRTRQAVKDGRKNPSSNTNTAMGICHGDIDGTESPTL